MILACLILVLSAQAPAPCEDLKTCRELAVAAQARQDYEAFHDLAWAAYRKGKSNDPELLLLVARAQSLSGRPGDALVMLERVIALGLPTDAATSEDFARVRALPRWPEVAARLEPAAPPAKDSAPLAKPPAPVTKAPEPAAKAPAPAAKPSAPAAKEPAPSAKLPAPVAKEPAPSANPPAPPAKNPALSFTTLLTPNAVAYDAVSRRFIIADRRARRIAVVDEETGQVATLVGAQGGLGDIGGMAIDPRQGDLWVVTTNGEGAVLHRMQLISGRVLATNPLTGIEADVVALTYARGVGLVAADATGTVWTIAASGRGKKLDALEYVPRALATDPEGRLYVAAGSPRLARFSIGSTLRKLDTVEFDPSIPADAPFTVVSGRLRFIVPAGGSFEILSLPVR